MPAYEVSRTLVKSAPEVWAELERVERLAELLGDGTIEIVSMRAESQLEWRGERASGTIEIAASGWGTKVKLTAEADENLVEAEAEEPEPEPVAEARVEPDLEPEPSPVPELGPEPELSPEPEIEAVIEPEPEPALEPFAEAKPKPVGFWKRLFGKPAVETEPTVVLEPQLKPEPAMVAESDPEPEVVVEPEPEPEVVVEPEPEVITEIAPTSVSEPVDYEALLTSVLDHLGSAHKRPFTHA